MPENLGHELLIVTGMSGAGRSTVGNSLEDLGWYVVDNLPPQMLGPIADLFTITKTPVPRLAAQQSFSIVHSLLPKLFSQDLRDYMPALGLHILC